MEIEILFWFLFALGLITLIGHGIWVFLAMIGRTLFGSNPQQPAETHLNESKYASPRAPQFCNHCGAVLSAKSKLCVSCGAAAEPALVESLDDLDAMERQLRRFHQQGVLDDLKFNWLEHILSIERQRITQVPPPAEVQPATPHAPPPPQPASVPIEPLPIPVSQAAREEVPLYEPPVALPQPVAEPVTPIAPVYVEPTPPPPPRKSFAEMLAAFMEEKNIRWGELLGGLLIIGCSLALVISLWAQIEQIPLLKFFIFTAMTGAFAGLGFYSEHRWKLPNTSRGLLITATMLVPLNFLAIAAFAKDLSASNPLVLGSELISLALFLFMVYRAGKIITPGGAPWLTIGVVGTAAMQLLLRRIVSVETGTLSLCLLAALPLACYAVATLGRVPALRRAETLEVSRVNQTFTLLSASSFAAVVALGLLLFKTQAFVATLQRIAPMVSLLALPALFLGLVLWQRVREAEPQSLSLISASIAVFSALVMLASLVFAWPNAAQVLGVALLNFAALTVMAFLFRLPAAHLFALPCFVLAYLVGVNWMLGRIETGLSWATLFSATSGTALAIVFVPLLAGSEMLYWRERRADGLYYAMVTAAVSALSLLLVSWHGFGRAGDPQHVAWIYALFAASAFYLTARTKRVAASYAGLGLLFLTFAQALYFGWQQSFKLTVLLYATMTLVAAVFLRKEKTQSLFALPSQHAALATTTLTGAILLVTAPVNSAALLSGQTLWLALLTLLLAWLYRSPLLFTIFQAITYASVFFAVTAALHGAVLLAELPLHLRDFRGQMLALALLSPAWIVLRLGLRRFGITREAAVAQNLPEAWENTASRLLYPEWPTCDQVVTWLLIAGVVALCMFGVLPGVAAEIAPTLNVALPAVQLARGTEWLLLGALLLVLAVSLWEQLTRARVLGLLLLLAMSAPLLAQSSVAAASTWRWAAAAYLLLASCTIWWRERLYAWAQALRFPLLQTESVQLSSAARALTLLLGATPILALTFWAADRQIGNGGLRVPGEWFFAALGGLGAYLVPLLVLSLVLVGHAIRERTSGYALAGGFVLNLAASLAFLNTLSAMTEAAWVRLAQINSITSAVFTLGWLGALAWQQRRVAEDSTAADWVLKIQVKIGAALIVLVLGIAGIATFLNPAFPGTGRIAAGSVWGWLALLLSGASIAGFKRLHRLPVKLTNTSAGLLAVGVLLACTVSRWDLGDWLGYHTLLVAVLVIGVLLLVAGFREQAKEQDLKTPVSLTLLFGVLACVLGARTLAGDPQNPWWAVATFAAVSGLALGLARLTRWHGYLYAVGLLVNVAVSVWHVYTYFALSPTYFLELLAANVIALALSGITLFAFERKVMAGLTSRFPLYHHVASVLSLLGVSLPVVLGLLRDYAGQPAPTNFRLAWAALLATAALLTAMLCDARANYAAAGLYLLGLVSAGLALDQANLAPASLQFAVTMLAALYVMITSGLWAARQQMADRMATLGIPPREIPNSNWLIAINLFLIAGITWSSGWIVWHFASLPQRLLAACGVALQALSCALLTRGAEKRAALQTATFGWGLLGAILLGWALLQPGANLIARLAIVLIVTIAAAESLGLWFVKRFSNEWSAAARRLIWPLCIVTALTLGSVLAAEISAQIFAGAVVMPGFAILSVVMILFGLSMQAIYFAVRAERDPLRLSERGRMNYVYASEALLALTFLHIRLTMPWLFSGFFARYWPFVVMALAFLGVGLGELFRRRGQRVLGDPLLNTGFFLPLFPVVGFWLAASRIDYSGLLLLVGVLYAVVAVLRSSFGVSLLACLAANGSLWYFLSRMQNFSLLERPQLWLMPAAVSVLIAAYLNRERLTAAQMTNLRYVTLSVIYVSSTAEIFIRGVALSPWQPMVLMLLSAAGVLAGILLRVRAFLYLGSSFLLISIVSMIWHASANFGWTWLWYVTGILAGLAIILLFAMFEKKRSELLRLVEGLRTWEA
ncbi:MAG: hypothetical protein U0Y68_14405 [Blastocatellia bacterium]